MSAYYDLFEKPDVRQTGEQQSLYARFVPKGTIDRKEFIERVHLFTGLSRSLLEGAMAGFMDELRDCLANGWTVELGELGYFTPSADEALGVEQRWQLLDEYLQQYPCINRSQYARLAGRSYKQAVVDLNRFIEEGVLMRHGMGPSVVYARKR